MKTAATGDKGHKLHMGFPLNLRYRTESSSAGIGMLVNTHYSWKKEIEV